MPCARTGQDGGLRVGVTWPQPRFLQHDQTVLDKLTGLMWTKDASPAEFPLMWQEALDYVKGMNTSEAYGFSDWRLPNRRELFSVVSHVNINPALPENHSFINVFSGYYWTSTTCARLPSQAWYVHLGGARVFKGMKHGSYMVWPVRGGQRGVLDLPRTGQQTCFNESGEVIPCADTGQDGALQRGGTWPERRYTLMRETVLDNLTGLIWARNANTTAKPVNWQLALDTIKEMNAAKAYAHGDWRLPNIREMESLTDMASHTPALPAGHPFEGVQAWYWSSTTSTYDPRYAWVLYMVDGVIGVGYKPNTDFFVWPVRGGMTDPAS